VPAQFTIVQSLFVKYIVSYGRKLCVHNTTFSILFSVPNIGRSHPDVISLDMNVTRQAWKTEDKLKTIENIGIELHSSVAEKQKQKTILP
jgi:hypothetical protein